MKRIVQEFIKASVIGVIVFIVFGIIRYFNGSSFLGSRPLVETLLYNEIYSVVLYGGNAVLIYYLKKKYKNELYKGKHLLKGIFGGVLITITSIFILRFVNSVFVYGKSAEAFIKDENLSYYYGSFIVSMIIIAVFYSIFYYKHKQETKVKEQKIIAGTASAKFDALKNQLDPHFLFNSLNVLTSLIEENPSAATKFTTALSKVYRYVLEQKNKDLVTVAEELKFARLYMSLIEMRFEDSIVFTLPEKISNPEAKVVPLSLQLLLENAVKHNQVMPSKKLYISIEEHEGTLVIVNNIQTKQVLRESTGVGLKNIRERYELLTNRPVQITNDSKQFSVAIPMLTKETMTMNTQDTFISEKKYSLAKEQVEKLKGFYIHFGIYLLFVPVFIWLNYISNAGFPWAIFPIGGWGFGVLSHAAETFDFNPFFGKNWEERKIKELMEKDKE
ncbi:2TM domain-containing protein [Ulvibacter litoralis]|uniref:Histidine kinase n=1 Tax=Ulvibacter litoralis TaxID=227084 RepID=A0A1G7EZU8_9FLAO|nr:2TM domain-containing protein [Ulvibacter litoralis]GHC53270.1 histidine kinase [Ulvibacter litoralis]SDE69202.1 Histidine kinase [Ulvibacter litoralis]